MPVGSGNALGGGAYCTEENCTLAVRAGREPYFEPKKNHKGNGMSARAKLVRL